MFPNVKWIDSPAKPGSIGALALPGLTRKRRGMSTTETPQTIPAATVIIFRNGPSGTPPELLMVQRAKDMRFAGGAVVFPGGKIDPADFALAKRIAGAGDQRLMAARLAAIRETLEETGLAIGLEQRISPADAALARDMLREQGALAPVLDRFGWTLRPDRLDLFAHWCPHWAGAFDTHFFLADLGTGAVDIAIDQTENTRLFWISAAHALAQADAGAISLLFPTRRNLERLALFSSHAEAQAQAQAMPVRKITPWREERDGEPWLIIPEGLGYPVLGEPLEGALRH